MSRELDWERLRALHERALNAVERPFLSAAIRWFREQEQDVLRRVRNGIVRDGLRPGVTVLDLTFDVGEESEKFGRRTIPHATNTVLYGADMFAVTYGLPRVERSLRALRAEKAPEDRVRATVSEAFDVSDPDAVQMIQELSFPFWKDVHAETQTRLVDQLAEGLRNQETNRQLQTRVQDVFAGTARGSAARSRVIVRTEVNGAMNAGNYLAGIQSEVCDRKQWLSSRDPRVRDRERGGRFTHAIEEVVRIQDPFVLTGEPMRFPGDPRGSAGNRINCRCSLVMLAYEVPSVARRRPSPDVTPLPPDTTPAGPTPALPPDERPTIQEAKTWQEAVEQTRTRWVPFMEEDAELKRRQTDLVEQAAAVHRTGNRAEADRLWAESEAVRRDRIARAEKAFVVNRRGKASDLMTDEAFDFDASDRALFRRLDEAWGHSHTLARFEAETDPEVIRREVGKIAKRGSPSFWSRLDDRETVRFGRPVDGRGFHLYHPEWGSDAHFLAVNTADKRSIWHEFGHRIESQDPTIGSAASAFWRERTQNDEWLYLAQVFPGRGYGRNERVKRDQWKNLYTGKSYGDGRNTEIVSTAVERMMSPLMWAEYYHDDPEHWAFVQAIFEERIPGMRAATVTGQGRPKGER